MGTKELFGMIEMSHILIEVVIWVYKVVKTYQILKLYLNKLRPLVSEVWKLCQRHMVN